MNQPNKLRIIVPRDRPLVTPPAPPSFVDRALQALDGAVILGDCDKVRSLITTEPTKLMPRRRISTHARDFITTQKVTRALELHGVSLAPGATDKFPTFTRVEFKQYATVGGRKISVRGGYVHVYMDKSGRVFAVNSSVRKGARARKPSNLISQERAVELAKGQFGTDGAVVCSSELMFSSHQNRMDLVYEIVLASNYPRRFELFLVNAATGEVVNQTNETQISYPLGLDFAGGRPSGADLVAAGVQDVFRYVADGGEQLPDKLLIATEASNYLANGLRIVSNFESDGRMDGGAAQGASDARIALANHLAAGGPPNPVIYFSVDYDAPPQDQGTINAYLAAAAAVLGGPQFCGIYAGYWPLSRALDAGVCNFSWQTEAWSGGLVDPRINVLQQNSLGYMYVDGVQCDIDQVRTLDFGQWVTAQAPKAPKATRSCTRVWNARPFQRESAWAQAA